jgi:hypothetical protein
MRGCAVSCWAMMVCVQIPGLGSAALWTVESKIVFDSAHQDQVDWPVPVDCCYCKRVS